MNYLDKIREYLLIKCELAIQPDNEKLQQLEVLQRYFLDQDKPNKFDPYDQDNVLMTGELNFEDVCNTMEDQGSFSPKKLTEFEFYNKLQFYKKKFKTQKDATKQV
jgi:hypothetical protein